MLVAAVVKGHVKHCPQRLSQSTHTHAFYYNPVDDADFSNVLNINILIESAPELHAL